MGCVPVEAPAGPPPGCWTLHPVPSGPLKSSQVPEVVQGPDKGRMMRRRPASSLGSERSPRGRVHEQESEASFPLESAPPWRRGATCPRRSPEAPGPALASLRPVPPQPGVRGTSVSSDPGPDALPPAGLPSPGPQGTGGRGERLPPRAARCGAGTTLPPSLFGPDAVCVSRAQPKRRAPPPGAQSGQGRRKPGVCAASPFRPRPQDIPAGRASDQPRAPACRPSGVSSEALRPGLPGTTALCDPP